MALAEPVTLVVKAAICYASSALDCTLPAMFALAICDCLVLGGKVNLLVSWTCLPNFLFGAIALIDLQR